MTTSKPFALVLVTTPDLKTARILASEALKKRLIACANLLPRVESHYRWQGKIEKSNEILMICKTTSTRLAALERLILALHPYETPEFLVLPVSKGNPHYLAWLKQSCA